ncbi:hypothetical protein MPC4_150045 [Methylocella tundrae]|uniref:Uncharacterized protein n=1 Tax=Methylocella tundrae TaxID=227605 RepID=A0A8B6M4G8_METTU|nr:hypothetical protein MPC1_3180003 [Methylocella tundrae]VTZ49263.1 hypothetical protein MPC4_150045 [Methylocella tundrae]
MGGKSGPVSVINLYRIILGNFEAPPEMRNGAATGGNT